MNNTFYYEHIGHMQFSTLTLNALIAQQKFTNGKVGKNVLWNEVREEIMQHNFSYKQANGELERFCYGYESVEIFDNKQHMLAMTHLGNSFIQQLTNDAKVQDCQLAILIRPSRKRNHWNITVQESTFWPSSIYNNIHKYKFRKGPARDFLKCLKENELFSFIENTIDCLNESHDRPNNCSLLECLELVEKYGKYWSSVGGKYSWFVFSQNYKLPSEVDDWDYYNALVELLVRPPEWGNGNTLKLNELIELIGHDRCKRFLDFGIIRHILDNYGNPIYYQLTAPGYLMWERKSKGPIYEILIRRLNNKLYQVSYCDASDIKPQNSIYTKESKIPSFSVTVERDLVANNIEKLLQNNTPLFDN